MRAVAGEGARVRRRPRPAWWDAAVAAGFFAFGCLLYAVDAAALDPTRGDSVPTGARIGLLALGCAAQLLRSRRPATALAAGTLVAGADLVLGGSLPLVIVLVDLLYCAALHGSRRTSRAVTVGALGLTAVAGIATAALTRDPRLTVLAALQTGALLLVGVFWGSEVRQAWNAAEAERASAAQAARIAELDRQAAVSTERARMARDLHDIVAGHLSAIAIQSAAVTSMAENPATARTVLRSVRENSLRALDEMRAMIGLLREDGAADPPRAPARLADLAPLLDSARAGGLQVTARLPDHDAALPVAVDLAAYRITQEALTNAVKHAAGSRTHVVVGRAGSDLVVEIGNELVDAAGDVRLGTGLLTMRERALAVGGSITTGPYDGGWRVRAVLPADGAT